MNRTTQAIYDRCTHDDELKIKLSKIIEYKKKERNKLSEVQTGELRRILNETWNIFEYKNNLEAFERRVKSEALKVSCGTFYIRYHNSLLMYRTLKLLYSFRLNANRISCTRNLSKRSFMIQIMVSL